MGIKSGLGWIYYVAKRFSLAGQKGAGAFTSRLSTLGICFGVMTLIIVVSVMNGFQGEFIDAIMEVSSYHARVQNGEDNKDLLDFLSANARVAQASEFVESESLASTKDGRQSAILARGVDADIMEKDAGFAKELKITRGKFNLKKEYVGKDGERLLPLVIGSSLARSLGLRVGDTVSLYSIASSRPLLESFSSPKPFVVAAIFKTGYADINSSYAFLEKGAAMDFFDNSPLVVGVKMKNSAAVDALKKEVERAFPDASFQSWREYNRSFFGALKVEKNMLLLLVVLIFLVVAINIFNSMRRIVYERRFEISILSALGGKISSIKNIFIMRGFLTGVRGALPGLVLGMFFCVNIRTVFAVLSAAVYFFQFAFALFFQPALAGSLAENPMFSVYGNIPAKMNAGEVAFITLFGVLSAVLSSWAASREVLATAISEVLHDE